jgi:hypothetical protein
VERCTDEQCQPILDALGDDLDELVEVLRGWSGEIRAQGGYLAGGADDLARTPG